MQINRLTSVAIIVATSFSTVAIGEARAQSAASTETEIAALKRQLLLMEQKLEALQKQTAANTTAAAKANAKADAKVAVTSANAAIPITTALAPSDVVVTMPGTTPTAAPPASTHVAATSRARAAPWTCPTPGRRRQAPRPSRSWSARLPALPPLISQLATSVPPSARAGTRTSSGPELM